MSIRFMALLMIIIITPLQSMKRERFDRKPVNIVQKKLRKEVCENSLVEFFGLDKRLGDSHLQHIMNSNIVPGIIPNGWWVPHVKLDYQGKKYDRVRIVDNGNKIVTFLKGKTAALWNAHNGTLLSECHFDDKCFSDLSRYREDTHELLLLSTQGILSCWSISQNTFRYTTNSLGKVCRCVWSADKKKMIVVYDFFGKAPAVLIDTTTGKIDRELVKDTGIFDQVGFVKKTDHAIVFLNFIGNYEDDDCVTYKKLPFQELQNEELMEYRYIRKENKLAASLHSVSAQVVIVNVLDVENNTIKQMKFPFGNNYCCFVDVRDSNKLMLEYRDATQQNSLNSKIDIYDLESEQNIFTINSDVLLSFSKLNTEKKLLFVRTFRGVCLWNVSSQELVAKLDDIAGLSGARLNKQGDKFIVLDNQGAYIWTYKLPLFKQTLLRKLLNLYWQTSQPLLSIDSPKKLLDAVVQKFQHSGRIATRMRIALPEFYLDKDELHAIWDSFSEQMQGIIWRSILCKIKRYGK